METRILNDVVVHGSVVLSQDLSTFPATPRIGEIVCVNGRHYAYTRLATNYYSWLPIGVKQSAYIHTQGEPAATWVINHNLATSDYGLFVYDTNHNLVMVNHRPLSDNSIQVSCSIATAGTAVVFAVTDFAATNFATNSLDIGDVTLTAPAGELLVNGSPVQPLNQIPYDVAGAVLGKPANGDTVARFVAARDFVIPTGFTASQAKANTAASGSATFTVYKNGVSVGTFNFAAGQTAATFSGAAGTFLAGDLLTIVAPESADATLAGIAFTLAGTLL